MHGIARHTATLVALVAIAAACGSSSEGTAATTSTAAETTTTTAAETTTTADTTTTTSAPETTTTEAPTTTTTEAPAEIDHGLDEFGLSLVESDDGALQLLVPDPWTEVDGRSNGEGLSNVWAADDLDGLGLEPDAHGITVDVVDSVTYGTEDELAGLFDFSVDCEFVGPVDMPRDDVVGFMESWEGCFGGDVALTTVALQLDDADPEVEDLFIRVTIALPGDISPDVANLIVNSISHESFG